jgi:small-conductance mechanosensitive channel
MNADSWPTVFLIAVALLLTVQLFSDRERDRDPDLERRGPGRSCRSATLRVVYLVYAGLYLVLAVIGALVMSALEGAIAAFAVAVAALLAAALLLRLAGPTRR